MDADVVVVGAGPTGLLLAGELTMRGVAVIVLERRNGPSPFARAFVVHARTLEVLDARALADPLVEAGTRVSTLRLPGGTPVVLDDLPSRFRYMLAVPQPRLEALLTDRAREHGADIRYTTEVENVAIDGTGQGGGATTNVRASGGGVQTLRSRYVVGTDGVGSTVRRSIGLPFPGRSVVQSVMLADVRLADPPPDELRMNSVAAGFAFLAPLDDGWYRVVAWKRDHHRPDDAPVTEAEIRDMCRAALGGDFGMHDARWISRFHSDERQVPRYRVGPVFLAGDASHVHSPVLGQGLNTGIQDAANLGWKLAATIGQNAAGGLLDSYHGERHAVGRQILRSSGAVLRMTLLRPAVLRAARDLAVSATRLPPLRRRINESISGIDLRYPRPPGAHPLVGARAPDVALAAPPGGPTRLYEALRTGRFVLVAAGVPLSHVPAAVDLVAPADASAVPTLVRPDGYIAWAGTADDLPPATVLGTAPAHS